jgi:hypothetical protein
MCLKCFSKLEFFLALKVATLDGTMVLDIGWCMLDVPLLMFIHKQRLFRCDICSDDITVKALS